MVAAPESRPSGGTAGGAHEAANHNFAVQTRESGQQNPAGIVAQTVSGKATYPHLPLVAEVVTVATQLAEPPDDAPATTIAAFFDVDNTVIRGASSYHLARELYRRKFFGLRDIIRFGIITARYLVEGESKEQIAQVRNRALALIKGKSVAEVVAIGEDVYDAVLSLRIFPGTKALIDDHIAAGHQVWFITASPVEIAALIARRLGATGALGTVAEHVDGFYTGQMVGDMMHGAAKSAAVQELANREQLNLAESYAYSDSFNDLPMMTEVGHPCAINPDARLRRYAKNVGWEIEDFRNRRQKMAGHSVQTVELAGAAWTLSVIIRASHRLIRRRLARAVP